MKMNKRKNSMNELINGRTDRTDERTNKPKNDLTNQRKQTNEQTKKWLNELMLLIIMHVGQLRGPQVQDCRSQHRPNSDPPPLLLPCADHPAHQGREVQGGGLVHDQLHLSSF